MMESINNYINIYIQLKQSEMGIFLKDRKIHGESNVWSTAQRLKKIYRFYVNAGFE